MGFLVKIFTWFFSNVILILLVLTVCYAYLYWDDPFASDTPAGQLIAVFSDDSKTIEQSAAEQMTDQPLPEPIDNAETHRAVGRVEKTIVEKNMAEQTMAEKALAEQTMKALDEASSVDATNVTNQSQTPSQLSSTTIDTAGSILNEIRQDTLQDTTAMVADETRVNRNKAHGVTTVRPQANAANESTVGFTMQTNALANIRIAQPPTTNNAYAPVQQRNDVQQTQQLLRQLIIDARLAYLNRDYDACIAAYQRVIAMDGENFDALGELGNVYFNLGEVRKAIDAYYQAANIMIAQGDFQRAGSLLGFLDTFDSEKAAMLRQSLSGQPAPQAIP